MLTPALVAVVPLLADAGGESWFHAGIVAIVVPVAAWALWNGYRTHRRQRVLWLGGVGILLISVAVVRADLETPLMITAGLILSLAHYFNLRVCSHSPH